ncbi:asparagine synthase (glutamine-hydrolyzing) [Cytobacillus depressus]|uniref:asparagine synthase (glutamine-hydrolyzing) n=1 Tax=Cytobacillus depressus TaxID=1602942 RepID=A0A6L3VCW3_9BACI|nr:asparagine synthase (glutamine-hydrolyzing) [Cytobacillus depressus]KAB2338902.1 asparagine synthase (glutamine-hydrolyzing) [Cytobacillus depressus]
MSGFIGYIQEKEQLETNQPLQLNHLPGPSYDGYYSDGHVLLGYRGLNMSSDEHEKLPLSYENDRYWIVYNGEIYNHSELREDLISKGLIFKSNSDSETILALYCSIKEKMVEKLRGKFAFVIWDKEDKVLFGARDPFGIKPLFYYEGIEEIYFASEKKLILADLQYDKLNMEALQHYLTFQFVPEPDTMTKEIRKLEPGHYFTRNFGSPMMIKRYWKAAFHPIQKQEDDFVREIRAALFQSIQLHMQGNVPIGSFLSGGIDSSIIASIAKEYHSDMKTFSVGFEQSGFSEIDIAEETAAKLGLENISTIITPEDFMNELPKIMWHLTDPLADPACIPLYFAAKKANKHVKVVLSGEGADELFGGYNIYHEPQSLKVFNYIPNCIKKLLSVIVALIPEGTRGKSFIERGVTPLKERYIGNAKIFTEQEKGRFFQPYDESLRYTSITSSLYQESLEYDSINRMQYIDIHTWLRGDILLKADKMTMAHLLELRAPFLDKEVFRVASKIPSGLKITNGTTKYILRKAMEGIVPNHVLHRKKLGFPVPIRYWLKDEMNDWAKKIIRESNTDHLFKKDYLYKLLDDHCNDKFDNSRKIWTVLMFMLWYAIFVEKKYEIGAISINSTDQ